MTIQVVGPVLNQVNAGDLMFVDRGGALNEMLVSSISIDHVALTADVGGTKTYTLYRSTDSSVVFGTFDVTDGKDGSGSSWPDYNAGTIYQKHQMVVDDDLRGYRCVADGTSATKPQAGGVVNSAWELINIGGLNTAHIAAQSYKIGDVLLVNGTLMTCATDITGSVGSPISYAVGRGQDQWYPLAEGMHPLFSTTGVYAIHDTVRYGAGWFQANGAMDGSQGSALVFAVGTGGTTWRALGTSITRVPLITDYTTEGSSTVHTIDAGCKYIKVEVQGAGGTAPTLNTSTPNTNAVALSSGADGGAHWAGYLTREAVLREFPSGITVIPGTRTTVGQTNGATGVAGISASIDNASTNIVKVPNGFEGIVHQNTSVHGILAPAGGGSSTPPVISFTSNAGVQELISDIGGKADGSWYIRALASGAGIFNAGGGGDSRMGRGAPSVQCVAAGANGQYQAAGVPTHASGFGYGAAGHVISNYNAVVLGQLGGLGIVRITEYFH